MGYLSKKKKKENRCFLELNSTQSTLHKPVRKNMPHYFTEYYPIFLQWVRKAKIDLWTLNTFALILSRVWPKKETYVLSVRKSTQKQPPPPPPPPPLHIYIAVTKINVFLIELNFQSLLEANRMVPISMVHGTIYTTLSFLMFLFTHVNYHVPWIYIPFMKKCSPFIHVFW